MTTKVYGATVEFQTALFVQEKKYFFADATQRADFLRNAMLLGVTATGLEVLTVYDPSEAVEDVANEKVIAREVATSSGAAKK